MAFFKTKQEKQIEEEMRREEQLQTFNDQIANLKSKREEYAKIAAEAEVNGDEATYDTAVNALLELNGLISSLMQTKANFDIINLSNSIAMNMTMAVGALEAMANNKANLPNLKAIEKVNAKVQRYMRNIKINNTAMTRMMKSSNPANKARTQAEIDSIRPMIDAARTKLTGISVPSVSSMDISAEIEAEKNKII